MFDTMEELMQLDSPELVKCIRESAELFTQISVALHDFADGIATKNAPIADDARQRGLSINTRLDKKAEEFMAIFIKAKTQRSK